MKTEGAPLRIARASWQVDSSRASTRFALEPCDGPGSGDSSAEQQGARAFLVRVAAKALDPQRAGPNIGTLGAVAALQ